MIYLWYLYFQLFINSVEARIKSIAYNVCSFLDPKPLAILAHLHFIKIKNTGCLQNFFVSLKWKIFGTPSYLPRAFSLYLSNFAISIRYRGFCIWLMRQNEWYTFLHLLTHCLWKDKLHVPSCYTGMCFSCAACLCGIENYSHITMRGQHPLVKLELKRNWVLRG